MDIKIRHLFSRYEIFPSPSAGNDELSGYISLFHIKCSIIIIFGLEMKTKGKFWFAVLTRD